MTQSSTVRRALARRVFLGCATVVALACASGPLAAQSGRPPLKVVLPVGAGSGVDATVRAMSDALSRALGTPLVIENVAGAGGVIGTQQIVRAAPDGNTIGVISNNHVVNPHVLKSIPYDSFKDITPIATLVTTPFVIAVNPKAGFDTVDGFLAAARAKPEAINFASSGQGTILHLCMEKLAVEAKVKLTHVPYRGVGPMMTDLLGGQVQMACVPGNVVADHLRAGTLKPLGVSTAARAAALPDLPTIAERGLPGYAMEGWIAVIGPAGLPAAEVARIGDAFRAVLADPAVVTTMRAQGHTIVAGSAAATSDLIRGDLERVGQVVRAAGITPE